MESRYYLYIDNLPLMKKGCRHLRIPLGYQNDLIGQRNSFILIHCSMNDKHCFARTACNEHTAASDNQY